MSQLLTLRDNIIEQIKGILPGTSVEGHLGRFSEGDLSRFLLAAPAVRVGVLGIESPQPTSDDGVDYRACIGIYVVTKDVAAAGSRDETSVAAVEAILKLTDRNRWNCRFAKPEGRATAQNLYSAAALSSGIALWAIDLRQPVRLSSRQEEDGTLPRLWLGLAPDIGAGHQDDYTLIGSDLDV